MSSLPPDPAAPPRTSSTVPPAVVAMPYPRFSSAPRALPKNGSNRWLRLAVRVGVLLTLVFVAGKCSLAVTDRPSFLGLATASGGASLRDATRVVIVLHGFGGDRNDMARLAPESIALGAPEYTAFVFAEGPYRAGFGRAWWVSSNPAEHAESTRRVSELVDDVIAKTGLAADHVYLAGFSQGAGLAFEVALARPDMLGGVISLSPCHNAVPWPTLAASHAPLRGVIVSGREDSICSFGGATQLQQELTAAGHDVQLVALSGGHRITPEGETALAELLKR